MIPAHGRDVESEARVGHQHEVDVVRLGERHDVHADDLVQGARGRLRRIKQSRVRAGPIGRRVPLAPVLHLPAQLYPGAERLQQVSVDPQVVPFQRVVFPKRVQDLAHVVDHDVH
eukprot:scaffold347_cov239-Pinguiococcus_pyrenoidosus.AAC.23